jgi:hypothetical protein
LHYPTIEEFCLHNSITSSARSFLAIFFTTSGGSPLNVL